MALTHPLHNTQYIFFSTIFTNFSSTKMFKQSVQSRSSLFQNGINNVIQVRNATKKVSGSKTNKNDSAGRRLGPKVHESNFVKPGQIIMRQRGTKIHPGENVRIGVDHTIYAVEPGYVRFYYDPFHPLRKFVGVSLLKDVKLPTPHFAPRVRRFGYEQITNPILAEKEESWMSRKEIEAQPYIQAAKEEALADKAAFVDKFSQYAANANILLNEKDMDVISNRFYEIYRYLQNGQSFAEAKEQASFNHYHDLKLAGSDEKHYFVQLFEEIDSKVSVDGRGNLYASMSSEEHAAAEKSTMESLAQYGNKVLKAEDKRAVRALIETPGVFSLEKQEALTEEYLPSYVPLSVPGSVMEDIDPENPPKGVVVQRVFDAASRTIKVIGRPKEAVE